MRTNGKLEGQWSSIQDRCNTMMYIAESVAVEKTQEMKLGVVEIWMLKLMCGITKLDIIGNERIRRTANVE